MSKRKFQAGDKVKVIQDMVVDKGLTGDIIRIDDFGPFPIWINTLQGIHAHSPEHLELVNPDENEESQKGGIDTSKNVKWSRIEHTEHRHGHPMFYNLLDKMADLHSRKNHDYSGTADPLRNLKSSKRLGLNPFMGVLVRLQDKWSRLESLSQTEPEVKEESIEDTLLDNAVYSLLAIILLKEQKNENK